ncbi:Intersectin-1 (EH and SH3 domains protein 1) [Erwinia pyrifoliae DSM 12163]|nr:Intersectin-1 (EH and SH3 domains protein 1) [Erwinia pyrifoliae DSM 12163]
MMKLYIIFSISLLTVGTFAHAGALCQQKEQAVQHEIDLAEKHDNKHRITGLQQALSEIRANCRDNDLKKTQREKIRHHEQKVTERKHELQQEIAKAGSREKIDKREKKLSEAQRELKKVLDAPY